MKYIDAEKLIAEIERYKLEAAIARFDNAGEDADYFQSKVDLCDDLTHIITSLQQEQPEIKSYIEELLKECAGKDGEYYRSRRETLARLFAYLGGNPSEYILQPVKQPEVDLEKEIKRYTKKSLLLPITNKVTPMDIMESDWIKCARHFFELGLNARK